MYKELGKISLIASMHIVRLSPQVAHVPQGHVEHMYMYMYHVHACTHW